MSTSQLIIFDCDGVLVDSEPLSNRVIAEEITKMGFPLTMEKALSLFAGGSLQNVSDFIATHVEGSMLTAEDFEELYRVRTKEVFQQELVCVEGVEKMLTQLPQTRCVGSNGPMEKIVANLNKTNLMSYFEGCLFSAYDIQRWKPEPHLYLHAAQVMGFSPSDCIVVEDSVHGVEAAVAAGMPVFAYTATMPAEQLKQAGAILFDNMHELPRLINQL